VNIGIVIKHIQGGICIAVAAQNELEYC
jgi:hypothetical protein